MSALSSNTEPTVSSTLPQFKPNQVFESASSPNIEPTMSTNLPQFKPNQVLPSSEPQFDSGAADQYITPPPSSPIVACALIAEDDVDSLEHLRALELLTIQAKNDATINADGSTDAVIEDLILAASVRNETTLVASSSPVVEAQAKVAGINAVANDPTCLNELASPLATPLSTVAIEQVRDPAQSTTTRRLWVERYENGVLVADDSDVDSDGTCVDDTEEWNESEHRRGSSEPEVKPLLEFRHIIDHVTNKGITDKTVIVNLPERGTTLEQRGLEEAVAELKCSFRMYSKGKELVPGRNSSKGASTRATPGALEIYFSVQHGGNFPHVKLTVKSTDTKTQSDWNWSACFPFGPTQQFFQDNWHTFKGISKITTDPTLEAVKRSPQQFRYFDLDFFAQVGILEPLVLPSHIKPNKADQQILQLMQSSTQLTGKNKLIRLRVFLDREDRDSLVPYLYQHGPGFGLQNPISKIDYPPYEAYRSPHPNYPGGTPTLGINKVQTRADLLSKGAPLTRERARNVFIDPTQYKVQNGFHVHTAHMIEEHAQEKSLIKNCEGIILRTDKGFVIVSKIDGSEAESPSTGHAPVGAEVVLELTLDKKGLASHRFKAISVDLTLTVKRSFGTYQLHAKKLPRALTKLAVPFDEWDSSNDNYKWLSMKVEASPNTVTAARQLEALNLACSIHSSPEPFRYLPPVLQPGKIVPSLHFRLSDHTDRPEDIEKDLAIATEGLTDEQSAFIRSAIDLPNGMFFLQARGGTGKTKTMYRLADLLIKHGLNVLISSSRNTAINEWCEGWRKEYPDATPALRLYTSKAESSTEGSEGEGKADQILSMARYLRDDTPSDQQGPWARDGILEHIRRRLSVPDEKQPTYKAFAKTLTGFEKLPASERTFQRVIDVMDAYERCKEAVIGVAKLVATTCTTSGSEPFRTMFASQKGSKVVVLNDEAHLSPEAEALIAVAGSAFAKKILLWGLFADRAQGRPFNSTVGSDVDEFVNSGSTSIFDRSLDVGVKFHTLTEQRRSHPIVDKFAAKRFYHGKTTTHESKDIPLTNTQISEYQSMLLATEPDLDLAEFTEEMYRLRWFEMRSPQPKRSKDQSKSRYNTHTLKTICMQAKERMKLYEEQTRKKSAIVVPYRKQKELYLQVFRMWITTGDFGKEQDPWQYLPSVITIDTAQGHEYDHVWLDLVTDNFTALGITADEARACVGLTRARESCWVFSGPIEIQAPYRENLAKYGTKWPLESNLPAFIELKRDLSVAGCLTLMINGEVDARFDTLMGIELVTEAK